MQVVVAIISRLADTEPYLFFARKQVEAAEAAGATEATASGLRGSSPALAEADAQKHFEAADASAACEATEAPEATDRRSDHPLQGFMVPAFPWLKQTHRSFLKRLKEASRCGTSRHPLQVRRNAHHCCR